MTVAFRNVKVDPHTEPEDWPFEAILTALERGSLSDWRRLVAAIRRQPWGSCARAVELIVSWREHDSIGPLFAGVLEDARTEADRIARVRYGAQIRAIRSSLGLSLRELAPLIGTSASRLSSYENGTVAPTVTILGRLDAVRLSRRKPGTLKSEIGSVEHSPG